MQPLPHWPLILDALLYTVFPALCLAAAVMGAVMFLAGAKHGPLAAALGITAGTALGLWLRDSLTLIAGDSSWNRLLGAALAALWVGRVARQPGLQSCAGWLLRAAASALISWVVIPAETRLSVDWLAPAFAIIVFALWALLEQLAAEPPDGAVPFCLAATFLTAGAVLIHAGSARLMDTSVVVASALAGIGAVAWWRRVDAGGAIPAAAVLLPGFLLMGQQETFSDVPWYAFALPALAPLLLAEALPLSQWQGTRLQILRMLLMLFLMLLPLAAAVYLAQEAGPLDFGEP